jgi:uncharacterized protein
MISMNFIQLAVIMIFIIITFLVLSISHFFVYYSLINFLKIINPNVKTALIVALVVLPLSFILSSILAHWSENRFTKIYYFASSLWLGVVTKLVIAFLLGWLVVWGGKFFDFQANYLIIGILAIVISLAYSAYGVWNSYHPRVKEITVKIKNLPVGWQGKTAVQISDLHLGHVFGQKFLQEVVDKINVINPEIVFITGDLFDGMDGQLDFQIKPLDQIKAPLGIYYITGNHETYFGVLKTYSLLRKTKVNILADHLVNLNGLQIMGISYPERDEVIDLGKIIREMPGYIQTEPAVLLYHSPVQINKIKASGINLLLSGHTHRGQIFPFNFVTYLIYHGYDYGLRQNGDLTVYTTSGTGTWGPTMRTGNHPEIVKINFE